MAARLPRTNLWRKLRSRARPFFGVGAELSKCECCFNVGLSSIVNFKEGGKEEGERWLQSFHNDG